jgi:hypothetical protein
MASGNFHCLYSDFTSFSSLYIWIVVYDIFESMIELLVHVLIKVIVIIKGREYYTILGC